MQSGLVCVCLRVKMHHNMWEGKDSCTMGEWGGLLKCLNYISVVVKGAAPPLTPALGEVPLNLLLL